MNDEILHLQKAIEANTEAALTKAKAEAERAEVERRVANETQLLREVTTRREQELHLLNENIRTMIDVLRTVVIPMIDSQNATLKTQGVRFDVVSNIIISIFKSLSRSEVMEKVNEDLFNSINEALKEQPMAINVERSDVTNTGNKGVSVGSMTGGGINVGGHVAGDNVYADVINNIKSPEDALETVKKEVSKGPEANVGLITALVKAFPVILDAAYSLMTSPVHAAFWIVTKAAGKLLVEKKNIDGS